MVDARTRTPAVVPGSAFGTPPRLAFLYIRVSTAHDDMFSPEQQRIVCEKYARENNIRIVEEIPDLDLSGRTFTKRKVMGMIERVRNGEASVVLVWQYSRWARNAGLGIEYINTLEQAGGDLIAVTEDADTKTTSGKLMRGLHLLFAEHYSNMVGDNWKLTHERRRKNGLFATGRPRFGYKRCPKCTRSPENPKAFLFCKECLGVPVFDDLRAEPLRIAYRLYVEKNLTFAKIADVMRERGVRSIDGHAISNVGWKKIMDSGFAAGFICQEARAPLPDGKKHAPSLEHMIWYVGKHDPIITEELWIEYKDKRLKSMAKNPAQLRGRYSVSGLGRCGQPTESGEPCLGALTAQRVGTVPYRVFRCSTHMRFKTCPGTRVGLPMLEGAIKEWVLQQVTDDGTALLAMQHSAEREKSLETIKGLKVEAGEVEKHKERLLNAYLAGAIDLDTFTDRKNELEASLQHINDQLEAAGEVIAGAPPKVEQFEGLLKIWDLMTPEELNNALKELISYVIVYRQQKWKHKTEFTIVPRWVAPPIDRRGRLHLNPSNPQVETIRVTEENFREEFDRRPLQ